MITPIVQRWREKRPVYKPAGETIRTAEYDVAEIDELPAKSFVETHHYSGSYPAARRRFGLFRKGMLAGVAVFSQSAGELVITNVFGCARSTDGLELGRFVLVDSVPANGESWFLARCFAALRRDYVGVLSFADPVARTDLRGSVIFPGHVGTIYQASNAAFLGRATPRSLRILPDGTVFSDRANQKIRKGSKGWRYASRILEHFGAAPCPDDPTARLVWLDTWKNRLTRALRHPGNYRYAWSFSRAVRLSGASYPKIFR